MQHKDLPVAIIGGGPIGMAAAAHLAKRKMAFILFESGSAIGTNLLNWGHVMLFSPWRYNIDAVAEALLLETGWQSPDKESLHTGKEFYDRYLFHLAKHPLISPFIHLTSKVISIGKKNMDKMKTEGREEQPFVLKIQQQGINKWIEARAVIDATGTWGNPNPIGSGGLYAYGETENKENIYYGIPDVLGAYRDRYKNKNVLVIGGGYSAITSILALNKLQEEFPETTIHWVLRKKHIKEAYGGQANDSLPARGALGIKIEQLVNEGRLSIYTPFQIQEIKAENNRLTLIGTQYNGLRALSGIDEIISNTGSRPEMDFLREVRVEFDAVVESVPAIADLIDPNMHSCGTVRPHGELELQQREKDFYVVGMKSYGRAPTFLMATGYEQVRSIVAAMAGDMEAARRVELDLPGTGVCSSGISGDVACCGAETVALKEKAVCC